MTMVCRYENSVEFIVTIITCDNNIYEPLKLVSAAVYK